MSTRHGLGFAWVLLIGIARIGIAQDIIVTRTDDPAPNGCTPTDCSLREAVIAANVDPVAYNDIRLGAATYQVNGTPLAVTGGTRFQGAGSTQTLIRGDGVTDLITFVSIHQLDLVNLALDAQGQDELVAQNGNAVRLYRVRAPNPLGLIEVRSGPGDDGDFSIGESEILAQVDSVDKRDFSAFDSRLRRLAVGSISGDASSTVVGMYNVVVDGSPAPELMSRALINTEQTTTLSDVTITQTSDGLLILGDTVSGNSELHVDRLRYTGNRRPVDIRSTYAVIARSEFLQNVNSETLNGVSGALLVGTNADVTVEGSTFSGNSGGATAGGAVRIVGDGARVNLRNSTFSGNSIAVAAANQPGGARGAAIGWSAAANDISVILRHVTVVAPTALPVGLSGSAIGGFGAAADVELRISNSLLRGSCSFAAASIVYATGNIESSATSCGFPSATNQVGVSAAALALGNLAYNGGRTQTIVPGAGSVAIDAGTPAYYISGDQRGYPRSSATADVGAVERSDVIFADGLD